MPLDRTEALLMGSENRVNPRWQRYPDIIAHDRGWPGQLPPPVADKIAWRNGALLFGLE